MTRTARPVETSLAIAAASRASRPSCDHITKSGTSTEAAERNCARAREHRPPPASLEAAPRRRAPDKPPTRSNGRRRNDSTVPPPGPLGAGTFASRGQKLTQRRVAAANCVTHSGFASLSNRTTPRGHIRNRRPSVIGQRPTKPPSNQDPAKGEHPARGIPTEERLHQHLVSVGRDRVRHTRRRDTLAVPEGRIGPGADLAAHGSHPARSLPARDPETCRCLHGLRNRHARHGLV